MLAELSLKEHLLLCRRAEEACARRFRMLLERTGSSDRSLYAPIEELAQEEEAHATRIAEFDRTVAWPLVWHADEAELDRIIRRSFPTLARQLNEHIDREEILRIAGDIEAESSSFYRALAELAPDDESRAFFTAMAEQEESHVQRLDELSAP